MELKETVRSQEYRSEPQAKRGTPQWVNQDETRQARRTGHRHTVCRLNQPVAYLAWSSLKPIMNCVDCSEQNKCQPSPLQDATT